MAELGRLLFRYSGRQHGIARVEAAMHSCCDDVVVVVDAYAPCVVVVAVAFVVRRVEAGCYLPFRCCAC